MYQITGWEVLSNLFLLLFAVLLSWKAFKEPFEIPPFRRLLVIASIFLIYLYAFHDFDYLGYKIMVDSYSSHFEDIYLRIVDFVSGNYFLFRLIVFGSSFLLMLLSFKRLNVGFDLCFLFYVMTSVAVLSYGRFTLALSLSFLGYTYIIKPFRFRMLSFAIGIALIVFSISFHRSALILVPIYIGAMFIHRFNRRNIALFIGLVGVIVGLYLLYGVQLLSLIVESDVLEEYQANRSFSSGSGGTGIGMRVHRLLQYSKYYLSLILFVIVVLKHDFKNWPLFMKILSAFFVLIMIIALLFSFSLQDAATGLLYYRTLYYSSISMCVFLAYCYKLDIRRKFIKIILYLGLLSQIYEFSYHAYHAFRGMYVA